MRTAGLPNFRKLWGRIETTLEPGKYELIITNSSSLYLIIFYQDYDVNSFGGTKSVILSTSGAFGGKNIFLGVTYFIVGSQ